MSKLTRLCLIFACVAMGSAHAAGAPSSSIVTPASGAYFLAGCRDLANKNYGAGDALNVLSCGIILDSVGGSGRLLSSDARFCKPASADDPEMAAVLVRYLDGHGDILDQPLTALSTAAFHQAWPCS